MKKKRCLSVVIISLLLGISCFIMAGCANKDNEDKDDTKIEQNLDKKEDAEAKCFELSRKWVDGDSFTQYIKDNKITQISLETYNDYYLEIADDSYVGIKRLVLEP